MLNVPKTILGRLPTPCLLIDRGAAERNIRYAADFFRNRDVMLRPHFKAHKLTRLMRLQLAAGACSGVTCQTSWEALVLARAGFDDILVTNQIADDHALAELAAAAMTSRVGVAVDSLSHVGLLQRQAEASGARFGVVIELDVGMGRCGLPVDSDQLLPIAGAILASTRLDFWGIQAYEGHIVMKEDRELRRTCAWQSAAQAKYEKDRLEAAGFTCRLVTGGGTGTFDLTTDAGVHNEIQAGSYVLLDARYGALDLPFENALFCVTTVISRRARSSGVLNVGLKGLTVENGMPKSIDGGIRVIGLDDEHARIWVDPETRLDIGDTVCLIPAHVDPAMNLHDAVFVWDERSETVERWTVDGRRTLPQAFAD